jgi:hypothetical protein
MKNVNLAHLSQTNEKISVIFKDLLFVMLIINGLEFSVFDQLD